MGEFDLDVLVAEIGPFKKYQLWNYILICIPIGLTAMYTLTFVFTAGNLDYRCKVRACEDVFISPPLPPKPDVFAYDFVNFSIPVEGNGKFSSCSMYRYTKDYYLGDGSSCSAANFDSGQVDNCELGMFVYQPDEKTIQSEWDLTCDQEWKLSFVGTVNNIGQFVCLPLTGFVSDKYGRKTAFILGILASALFGFARAFSKDYVTFIILEFLEPALGSGVYSAGFILGMELVDPPKRVLGTVLINCFYASGEALLGLIAFLTKEWRLLMQISYAPCFLFFIYFWMVPESVRWLVIKGRLNDARKVILKAARINNSNLSDNATKMLINDDEEDLKYLEQQKRYEVLKQKQKYPLLAAFKNRRILLRLAIISFCWITNTFVFYGLSINSVTLVGNKYLNYVLGCFIEIPAFVVCYFITDTKMFGRKRSLFGSLWLSGIACFCQLALSPSKTGEVLIGPLLLFLLGKCAITVAFTILYVYTSELFPTELRHSLLAFCSMFGRFGSMIAPQTPLLGRYMESLPMILFGGTAVISGTLILKLPETYNIALPDTIEEAEIVGNE